MMLLYSSYEVYNLETVKNWPSLTELKTKIERKKTHKFSTKKNQVCKEKKHFKLNLLCLVNAFLHLIQVTIRNYDEH